MKKHLYKFRNRNGLQVKGIFIKPDRETEGRRSGVIYLAGSVLGAVAVHNLGFAVTEKLAGAGYVSYLVEHSRIGESEGTLASDTSRNLNAHVVDGEMVEDTLEAIEHFRRECAVDDIILIGHCGGGLTALYTASRSDAVKGALLISTPILKEGEKDFSGSARATKEYRMLYVKKAVSLGAWKRLFTGKTDYVLLGRFFRNSLSRILRRKNAAPPVNSRFLSDLQKARKGKPVSMLMGDRDPGIEEFKVFAERYLAGPGESKVLKETSHGFVTKESIALLFDEVDTFLKRCYE